MRQPTLAFALLLLASCAGVRNNEPWDGQVRVDGALRPMLHEGKTGAVVGLDRLLPDPTLYAVGALADLSGEVTVVGGKVYVSRAAGGEAQTEVSEDTDADAALLVSARVPAWRQVSSTQPIGFDMLEGRIEELAKEAGLDVGGRIPFVVEGRVRELEWHVLGGAPPGGSAGESAEDHDAHLKNAMQFRLPTANATLVGFYSPSDEGVFTHVGSKIHLHCVAGDPPGAGHVDHVVVLPGATIRFPLKVAEAP